ncbi:hypothetical protein O6H91_07G026600 [Diphasiastrum complanatum]|uniref:Uncharacterized protein n=1 Tax=Diphasiastrum complanatum TaxID=34168 RepID=A0ACC2D3D0_DIPCM|nr:hypothetical protein O6H91_07G026600 [Diphasiastrum complanatum]
MLALASTGATAGVKGAQLDMNDSCKSSLQLGNSGEEHAASVQMLLQNGPDVSSMWDHWPSHSQSNSDECGSSTLLDSELPCSRDLPACTWLSSSLFGAVSMSQLGSLSLRRSAQTSESAYGEDLVRSMSLFPDIVPEDESPYDRSLKSNQLLWHSSISTQHECEAGRRESQSKKDGSASPDSHSDRSQPHYGFNLFQQHAFGQSTENFYSYPSSLLPIDSSLHYKNHLDHSLGHGEIFHRDLFPSTSELLLRRSLIESLNNISIDHQPFIGSRRQKLTSSDQQIIPNLPYGDVGAPSWSPFTDAAIPQAQMKMLASGDYDSIAKEDSSSSTDGMSRLNFFDANLGVREPERARGSPGKHERGTEIALIDENAKCQSNKRLCVQNSALKRAEAKPVISNSEFASQVTEAGASVGPALNTNGKPRARRGSATDPQSVYARHRRERINERLKILQHLVPNGAKVNKKFTKRLILQNYPGYL